MAAQVGCASAVGEQARVAWATPSMYLIPSTPRQIGETSEMAGPGAPSGQVSSTSSRLQFSCCLISSVCHSPPSPTGASREVPLCVLPFPPPIGTKIPRLSRFHLIVPSPPHQPSHFLHQPSQTPRTSLAKFSIWLLTPCLLRHPECLR